MGVSSINRSSYVKHQPKVDTGAKSEFESSHNEPPGTLSAATVQQRVSLLTAVGASIYANHKSSGCIVLGGWLRP